VHDGFIMIEKHLNPLFHIYVTKKKKIEVLMDFVFTYFCMLAPYVMLHMYINKYRYAHIIKTSYIKIRYSYVCVTNYEIFDML